MIDVTDTIKAAYEKSTTQYDKIILNNKEYFINNVQYCDDCYYEGNIFGTAIARTLEFEIESSIDLEETEFEYITGIKTENGIEWISLGNFITQDLEPNDTNDTSKITAMDYMLKSNIEYVSSLDYKSGTVTILQVLQEACQKAGITLATTNFANKDFIVDSNQFPEGTLIRQVFQAVAQISGTFAKIRNDNKLYFITPKRNGLTVGEVNKMTVEEFNSTEVGKLIACENQYKNKDYKELILKRNTHPINLVSLGMSDIEGENVVKRDEDSIAKDGENSLVINDNPFAYTEEKRKQLITALFDTVKGFEYTSFEITGQAKPYQETGDEVLVLDKEGYACNSFLFRFNYKSPNGLESEMSAPSITKATVNYQNVESAEKIAKRTELRVDKQEQTITGIIGQQTETGNKLTEIEQTIDGITQTVSSVETKVETVEGKADTAQNTANTANQNAQNAQTTADNAQDTADSAVNQITTTTEKVTQIEQTVEGITQNVTNLETTLSNDYSTTTEMNTAIEQSASSISSEVTKKIDNIQVGGTNLVPNSAPYNLDDYIIADSTAIELTLQDEETAPFGKCLRLKALKALTASSNGIFIYLTQDTLEVGKQYSFSLWMKATANTNMIVGYGAGGQTNFTVTTEYKKFTYTFTASTPTSDRHAFLIYMPRNTIEGRQVFVHSIKLEEGNKITAWSPSPDDDVKNVEFGTKIEQNARNVQVAWNNESQNIKIENDNGNSTMGFYDNDTKFAEMGVNNVDNDRYISFAVPCDYNQNIADGMAWGVQTPDGKFHPILFIKNFAMGNNQSDSSYGQLELTNCDLVISGNYELGSGGSILVGNLTMTGNMQNGISFIDDTGNYIFTIYKGDGSILAPYDTIKILDNIQFYKNQAGNNSFRIGPENKSCVLTDEGQITAKYASIDAGTGVAMIIHGEVYVYDGNINITDGNIYANNISSDRRLKEGIKEADVKALDIIRKIKHKQFKMKTDGKHYNIGYIAQELEKIDENFVLKRKTKEDEELKECQYYINELPLLATATKAIQEQDNLFQDLLTRVEKLEKGEQHVS